jgi:hypothetical protein
MRPKSLPVKRPHIYKYSIFNILKAAFDIFDSRRKTRCAWLGRKGGGFQIMPSASSFITILSFHHAFKGTVSQKSWQDKGIGR